MAVPGRCLKKPKRQKQAKTGLCLTWITRHLLCIGGLLVLVSCSAPEPASTPAPVAPTPRASPQYDFTAVDSLLEEFAPKLGGCVLVLFKDGEVIYRKNFGKYGADKVVPIASASKWLSGAVVMSLVGEAKLSLDDPVSRYLPEFSGDKASITIRQLFAHTSGLPPETDCRNNKSSTLEKCAREISGLQLRAQPGEEFYYGGVSMHLGGRILEIVSGKSWNDLFRERIAEPLGMAQTDFFAYGKTANPRPEGDARSSANDYIQFLEMVVNRGNFRGKQILSAELIEEMLKDQTEGAAIAYTIYGKHSDLDPELPRARYGIGVWREKVEPSTGRLIHASSQGALGFSPWIDLELNLAGVLSVQSSMSRVMPLYLELKKQLRIAISNPRG